MMSAALSTPVARPVAASLAPRMSRVTRRTMVVRANAPTPEPSTPEAAPVAAPTPVAAPVVPKTPTVGDVMAFSGPAPELVNGRLAMLGFVAALGAELSSGESILTQLTTPGAQSWILYAFVLFIGASLIPIFRGATAESFGPFSPKAELTNGRAAQIGFAAMLIIELVKGSALF